MCVSECVSTYTCECTCEYVCVCVVSERGLLFRGEESESQRSPGGERTLV